MLKPEDLIEGNIYYYKSNDYEYIFQSASTASDSRYSKSCDVHLKFYTFNKFRSNNPHDKGYNNVGSLYYNNCVELREVTNKEYKWLNACIKAGKYVDCPKDEIINDYQII